MSVKLNRNKIIGICGVVIIVISMFLPYISSEAYGFKSTIKFIDSSDAILVMSTIISALVLFILNKAKKTYYVLTVASLLVVIYDSINPKYRNQISQLGISLKYGLGFYLLIIGIIAFIVALVLEFMDNKKNNSNTVVNVGNNNFNQQQPVYNQQPMQQPMYNQPQQNVQQQVPDQQFYGQNNQNNN